MTIRWKLCECGIPRRLLALRQMSAFGPVSVGVRSVPVVCQMAFRWFGIPAGCKSRPDYRESCGETGGCVSQRLWASGWRHPGGRGWRDKHPGGQATKGVWGMSRRQEAMKGVEGCDKPGEAVKRALIPGYPNDHRLNP